MLSKLQQTGNLLPDFLQSTGLTESKRVKSASSVVEDDYRDLLENYRQQQMQAPKEDHFCSDAHPSNDFADYDIDDVYQL